MELKRLTVEIDSGLHAKAKSQAYAEGKKLNELVSELLEKWLRSK